MLPSDVTIMNNGAGTETMSLDALSLVLPHRTLDAITSRQYLETMCYWVNSHVFTPKLFVLKTRGLNTIIIFKY
jgi:hypothetical protein